MTDRFTSYLKKISFINGAALKWIAVITMLIDHFAIAVFISMRIPHGKMDIYNTLRSIGRIAFPIFIFLLCEGFRHTKNIKKYLLRLLIFALVSEIPFDLAVYGKIWSYRTQNVFFTLFLGLAAITLCRKIKHYLETSPDITYEYADMFYRIIFTIIVALTAIFAELLKTDYGPVGILAIISASLFPLYPKISMIPCCTALLLSGKLEKWAFLALIPIFFYNGKRGRQFKYFFYAVYPLHLLIFFLIRYYLL